MMFGKVFSVGCAVLFGVIEGNRKSVGWNAVVVCCIMDDILEV